MREFAEIPIPPEIEGVINQLVLSARGEFGLEFGEVGPPFMDNDHLAIDDRLAVNVEGSDETEKRFVQSSPLRVKTRFFPALMWIWTR